MTETWAERVRRETPWWRKPYWWFQFEIRERYRRWCAYVGDDTPYWHQVDTPDGPDMHLLTLRTNLRCSEIEKRLAEEDW